MKLIDEKLYFTRQVSKCYKSDTEYIQIMIKIYVALYTKWGRPEGCVVGGAYNFRVGVASRVLCIMGSTIIEVDITILVPHFCVYLDKN